MTEKNYEIHGIIKKKEEEKKFSKHLTATSESRAAEKVMALMGSKHALKRRNIIINEIREVKE
ncbi:MAG: 50S ribosomal protein L18Ae [archaeon]|nr:50S ribosomal protein L18Ae [archaeon]